MKLSLRFFIPLVGITALAVNTPAADMISHSGHARTRMEMQKNVGGADSDLTEFWVNRVRLNVDISPSKTLMVRLTPQANYTLGLARDNPANLIAQEAWMSWTASDMVTVYAGRQIWDFGKGLIVGANDWGATSNTFDALRFRLTYDMGTTDLFYAKTSETDLGRDVAGKDPADADLTGFYTQLNPDMGAVKNVDIYFLWNDNRTGGAARSRVATLGVRAEGDIHAFDYNAEVTGQMGKTGGTTDVKGIQMNAVAGTKIMNDHHVALQLDYANTEFTDQAPSMHAQLGKADILTARNNIMAFSLLTSWKLHEKWKAHVDGWYFMAAKDKAALTGGLAQVNGKRAVGMEGDLSLTYTPEKNLAIDCGYDLFKGGDALKPADKLYSGLYLQGTLTF